MKEAAACAVALEAHEAARGGEVPEEFMVAGNPVEPEAYEVL